MKINQQTQLGHHLVWYITKLPSAKPTHITAMVCQKTGDPRIQLSSYFPVFWLGYGQGWLHPHDKNLYLHDSNPYISFYLVGGIPSRPLWKIWKSVGMMKFPIYGNINSCSKSPISLYILLLCIHMGQIFGRELQWPRIDSTTGYVPCGVWCGMYSRHLR